MLLNRLPLALFLAAAAVLTGLPARAAVVTSEENAGVEDELTPGVTAYNAGQYENAAAAFYKVVEGSGDSLNRQKAEYYLGESYFKMRLLQPALGQYLSIFRQGTKHRYYFKAIEGLVNVAESLGDEEAIPSQLDKSYGPSFEKLPEEALNKVNYLLGVLDYRRNKVQEAQDFLSSLPRTSSYFARARYLYGLTLVGKRPEDAIKIFKEIMTFGPNDKQFDLSNVQQLARIALARTYYGQGDYQASVDEYVAVPRFSDYWD